MDQAILEKEALKLKAHERALLADALVRSLDTEAMKKIEAAWVKETEGRYRAYKTGKIKAVDGPSALKQLRARVAK